jgi:hypothetical protein
VFHLEYEHPKYEKHITSLLSGATLPGREVEDYEHFNLNRRFFSGEDAVRLLERVLGIDASITAIYSKRNNNYGAY